MNFNLKSPIESSVQKFYADHWRELNFETNMIPLGSEVTLNTTRRCRASVWQEEIIGLKTSKTLKNLRPRGTSLSSCCLSPSLFDVGGSVLKRVVSSDVRPCKISGASKQKKPVANTVANAEEVFWRWGSNSSWGDWTMDICIGGCMKCNLSSVARARGNAAVGVDDTY